MPEAGGGMAGFVEFPSWLSPFFKETHSSVR